MKIHATAIAALATLALSSLPTTPAFARAKPRSSAKPPHPRPRRRLPTAFQTPKTPADAKKILAAFERRKAALQRKFERQLQPLRMAAARKLKRLQDRLCRAAKLDAALAVRTMRMKLLGVRRDPGYLRATRKDIGRIFLFKVTGATSGSIWGTGVYTTDSKLATAAVHAGLLAPGQTGIVRVRILQGQPTYLGSTQNGVTSYGYGAWSVSFKVEAP